MPAPLKFSVGDMDRAIKGEFQRIIQQKVCKYADEIQKEIREELEALIGRVAVNIQENPQYGGVSINIINPSK